MLTRSMTNSRSVRLPPGSTVWASIQDLVRHLLRAPVSRSERTNDAERERLLLALVAGPTGATAEELALQTLVPLERTWRLLHQAHARGEVTREVRRGRIVWRNADPAWQREREGRVVTANRLGRGG